MSFRPLTNEHLGRGRVRRFQPGDPAHLPAAGIRLLREAQHDVPVYLVRVDVGVVGRVLRPVDTLRVRDLVRSRSGLAVTAYACAFEVAGEAQTILVARGRLPVPELPRLHALPE